MKRLLLFGLLLFSTTILRGQRGVQPQLIHKYEKGYSSTSLEENAAYLADAAGTNGIIAVRICSKETLPIALSIAAADPFILSVTLESVYGFKPERVMYLRSADCSGPVSDVAATEFWAIPKGAELPTSVESINSSRVHLKHIGAGASSSEGTRSYRAATQEVITKLRARPMMTGIVLGYYYRRPSSALKRRLREVRNLLEHSGLSKDRYFIHLIPWPGDRSIEPPEPEPSYPRMTIIELTRDSN